MRKCRTGYVLLTLTLQLIVHTWYFLRGSSVFYSRVIAGDEAAQFLSVCFDFRPSFLARFRRFNYSQNELLDSEPKSAGSITAVFGGQKLYLSPLKFPILNYSVVVYISHMFVDPCKTWNA